ncbi:MAG TPA: nuclear transport factor 2 family protein [Gammaproteobacteria bacterium]|nr:nuclear transport factor 2 family protein [Gammaproteobacteria bacterium]
MHAKCNVIVVAVLAVMLGGSVTAASARPASDASPQAKSMLKPGAVPGAEAVAQALQDALQQGDRTRALELLAPEARISEGGETQNVKEYAAHHLGADIAFLKSARVTLISRASMQMDGTAHVASESRIDATSKGKPLELRSHEKMELKQVGGEWKIVSIVWTSQRFSE